MSQDAKDVVPGGLSPLKPADAEVQKICDQVSSFTSYITLPISCVINKV